MILNETSLNDIISSRIEFQSSYLGFQCFIQKKRWAMLDWKFEVGLLYCLKITVRLQLPRLLFLWEWALTINFNQNFRWNNGNFLLKWPDRQLTQSLLVQVHVCMILVLLKCWLFCASELRVVPPIVNSLQVYVHTLAQPGRDNILNYTVLETAEGLQLILCCKSFDTFIKTGWV